MAIKTIPNDIVAEQSVLGAMFLSASAIEKATDKLHAKSFYLEKHGIMLNTWKELLPDTVEVKKAKGKDDYRFYF